jgi:hypothetical protein
MAVLPQGKAAAAFNRRRSCATSRIENRGERRIANLTAKLAVLPQGKAAQGFQPQA